MRRVKIICTIGPASREPDILAKLAQAGMNVARLNMSHGTHEYHRGAIERVRQVSEKLRMPIAILAALRERDRTGKGAFVESALFETAAFLMGQHMAYAALSQEPVPPMPARVSAWAVYELFETGDGAKVFIGITSDKHWVSFCDEFDRPDLLADETMRTNSDRIDARPRLVPEIARLFAALTAGEIAARCTKARLPFASVARPEDLFDDPHLNGNASLAGTLLSSLVHAKLPKLPIRLNGRPFDLYAQPPAMGADTEAVLAAIHAGDQP